MPFESLEFPPLPRRPRDDVFAVAGDEGDARDRADVIAGGQRVLHDRRRAAQCDHTCLDEEWFVVEAGAQQAHRDFGGHVVERERALGRVVGFADVGEVLQPREFPIRRVDRVADVAEAVGLAEPWAHVDGETEGAKPIGFAPLRIQLQQRG